MYTIKISQFLLCLLIGFFCVQDSFANNDLNLSNQGKLVNPFTIHSNNSTKTLAQSYSAAARDGVYGTRFSVMLNIRTPFDIREEFSDEATGFIYENLTAMSINLRFYNIRGWALRVGAGYQKLNYEINGGNFSIPYDAYREDYTLLLGVEKHFEFVGFDLYPGIVMPIAFVGDEKILSNAFDEIKNNAIHANIGVLLGGQIKLFRILRVGGEFYCMYDQFKQEVWQNALSTSEIKLRNINLAFDFVIGVAF